MNDFRESSTFNRMQEKYWATKQAVFKKLGKKNDDCIIASDSELDAKLELFQTIEESFFTLMKILESYQDRLCNLAQEENAMGRFLKENGKYDKTRAGKVMIGAGKALSFSAQQKLSLRIPLVRLYHEVETFQYQAIVDCLKTIEKMEKGRTAYRGALLWMKDVSLQLDPDTCKQLEKFRKVQSNVRKTKAKFDKLKLDTLQKVDLLSFSRCNLFSQALAAYQNTLITACEKVFQTMVTVAGTTKGYQHYEFSTIKELSETSKKKSEKSSTKEENSPSSEENFKNIEDKDVLLYFESEYFDEENRDIDPACESSFDNLKNCSNASLNQKLSLGNSVPEKDEIKAQLLDLDSDLRTSHVKENSLEPQNALEVKNDKSISSTDILGYAENSDVEKNTLELLHEILDADRDFNLSNHWSSVNELPDNDQFKNNSMDELSNQTSCFLPSQLLERQKLCASSEGNLIDSSKNLLNPESDVCKSLNRSDKDKKGKQDMSTWYNLFADLDPLTNPDLIGKKQVDEINC